MPFPSKMRGRRAADFLDEVQHPDGIRRAVGIAAMNMSSAAAQYCLGAEAAAATVDDGILAVKCENRDIF